MEQEPELTEDQRRELLARFVLGTTYSLEPNNSLRSGIISNRGTNNNSSEEHGVQNTSEHLIEKGS